MTTYFFDIKKLPSVDIVGGKGRSLIDMTLKGLNVPYGFIIPTDYWKEFSALGEIRGGLLDEIKESIKKLEEKSGCIFGGEVSPLFISVRSGAKFSMPGMMETILNVGITEKTLPGLIARVGEESALDSYQQFLKMFAHTVLRIEYSVLESIGLKSADYDGVSRLSYLTKEYKNEISKVSDVDLSNVDSILVECIKAVFKSYQSAGAVEYRNVFGIPHDIGTAVVIQEMVFGNISEKSGSAVIFSRNLKSGKRELTGHFLKNSQGENVVRGFTKSLPIRRLPKELYNYLTTIVFQLEEIFGDVVDVEVTWEDYRNHKSVYILQSRVAKVPKESYLILQRELIRDNVKARVDVITGLNVESIYSVFSKSLVLEESDTSLMSGSPLNTGIGVGEVVFSTSEAKRKLQNNEDVVLICKHFDPNDLELLTGKKKLQALVTTEGGPSSHMGLVLSVLNIPGVMGVPGVDVVDSKAVGVSLKTGDIVTVDSYSGYVYLGMKRIKNKKMDKESRGLVEDWEYTFGKRNYWADFASRSSYLAVENECCEIVKESSKFLSKKAVQTYFVNKFFGEEVSIYTDIIDSNDEDSIVKAIKKVKQEGKSVWLRSAYTPDLLQSPYTSSDLTLCSSDKLQDWVTNKEGEDEFSKFGKYQDWKSIVSEGVKYKMVYALVQHDQNDKLNKDLAHEHFVSSIRCEMGRPTKVIVDIFDGIPHTRVLGEKSEADLFGIVLTPGSDSSIGTHYLKFGENCFKADSRESYMETSIYKSLLANNTSISSFSEFVGYINKGLESSTFSLTDLEGLVIENKIKVARYVTEVLLNWFDKYDLGTKMWALNKVTGANVLEFQGRLSDTHKWMLIYGTKGQEEKLVEN